MGKFSGYLIVSDMDATLLCDNHTVSEKNRQAIEYFIGNGGYFTVATGRMVDAVKSYLKQMNINAPAVLHNGAKIYDFEKDTALFEKFIEEDRKQAIKRVYDELPEIGLEVYSDELVYVYRKCEETKRFLTRDYEVIYNLPDEVWDKPWIKVLLIGDKELLDKYEPIYREHYDSGYAVRSGSKFLDVVANGVSKGKGVERLIELLGLSQDKVIAGGDNMNDISMLEAAGISYAVENAEESTKQSADYIAPSNNDDAIAFIIENLEKTIK
ncbi:MAG: HAD family phosphatase [Clostridia bacterium]|nr:HAD family phosphatase [Clostridia bacterium]